MRIIINHVTKDIEKITLFYQTEAPVMSIIGDIVHIKKWLAMYEKWSHMAIGPGVHFKYQDNGNSELLVSDDLLSAVDALDYLRLTNRETDAYLKDFLTTWNNISFNNNSKELWGKHVRNYPDNPDVIKRQESNMSKSMDAIKKTKTPEPKASVSLPAIQHTKFFANPAKFQAPPNGLHDKKSHAITKPKRQLPPIF